MKHWEYPWVLGNLQLKKGISILDVGCGKSPIQFILADLGCKVYCADPEEKVSWHGLNPKFAKIFGLDIKYKREGGEFLSFPNNFFDRVICVSVLEHIVQPSANKEEKLFLSKMDSRLHKKILNELIRVLKPEGICVVTINYFIPRDNILPESNINVAELINVKGVEIFSKKTEVSFPGEDGFNYLDIIKNHDIFLTSYGGLLHTSIGFTLKKLTI